jgi:hypothetical protein
VHFSWGVFQMIMKSDHSSGLQGLELDVSLLVFQAATTTASAPVGADFKPITSTVSAPIGPVKPTFPAYRYVFCNLVQWSLLTKWGCSLVYFGYLNTLGRIFLFCTEDFRFSQNWSCQLSPGLWCHVFSRWHFRGTYQFYPEVGGETFLLEHW